MESFGLHKGSMGPVGLPEGARIVAARSLKGIGHWVVGANEDDYHYVGAEEGRDFTVDEWADLCVVKPGDCCPDCGLPLSGSRGIEVSQVFQLGTRYSETMGAIFHDEDGVEHPFIMGCYGVGVSRTVAAIVEQHNDENGIQWPFNVAPAHVCIIPLAVGDDEVQPAAEKLASEIADFGFDVVIDDRKERAGVKFADADLIGWPLQVGHRQARSGRGQCGSEAAPHGPEEGRFAFHHRRAVAFREAQCSQAPLWPGHFRGHLRVTGMGKTSSIKGVLFDLDGTLVDTEALILASFRYATKTVLGRDIPDEELRAKIGQPLTVQMRDWADGSQEVHDKLFDTYLEHNDRVHSQLIRSFPGTTVVLGKLAAAGLPLGIVTSKRSGNARRAMESTGIEVLRLPRRARYVPRRTSPTRRRCCTAASFSAFRLMNVSYWRQPLRFASGSRRRLRDGRRTLACSPARSSWQSTPTTRLPRFPNLFR